MKKIVSLLAALALLPGLLCFAACSPSGEKEAAWETDEFELAVASGEIERYVVRNEHIVRLVLPATGEHAAVYGPARLYLDTIDLDALRATETRLTDRIPQNEKGHAFYVAYKDGGMILGAEVIVPLNPPKDAGGGCGIDHDHVFLEEPIRK